MKRQRGRGRKPGNPANRTYESNGPEVKIRGNASQIYDKYLQLARDASSAGDRVRAENLYQHAEHYFRIIQANQPKREPGSEESDENNEATAEGAEGEEQSAREPRENRRSRGRRRSAPETQSDDNQDDNADPLGVVTPEGEAKSEEAKAEDDEEGGSRRRTRRPRRSRSEKASDDSGENAETSSEGTTSDSESEAA